MKVLFINRYAWPDQSATARMLEDVSLHLARRGWNVEIWSSNQLYDDPNAKLPKCETREGIRYRRISTTRFGRANLFLRSIDFISFYIGLFFTLRSGSENSDWIVYKTDPPLLAVISRLTLYGKSVKQIHWSQDVFPEILYPRDKESSRNLSFRALRSMRNWGITKTERFIVLGEAMKDTFVRQGISPEKIEIIPNWAHGKKIFSVPHQSNPLRQKWNLQDAFVVGYSGNLGRVHDVETLILAIPGLMELANVHFVFIGGGTGLEPLQKTIRSAEEGGSSSILSQTGKFRFYPLQPDPVLHQSLSLSDIHLVSLAPAYSSWVFPSKIYGIMAAGRPILFIGDSQSEPARFIKDNELGRCVPTGDPYALIEAVRYYRDHPESTRETGIRARALFEKSYDFPHAMERWEAALDHGKTH